LDSTSSSLMERIVDEANMEAAWKRVKTNGGAPGPDGVTIDEFFDTFRHHWPDVRRQLLEGTYRPTPVRRKSIPKPDGGERHLGIPSVPVGRPEMTLTVSFNKPSYKSSRPSSIRSFPNRAMGIDRNVRHRMQCSKFKR